MPTTTTNMALSKAIDGDDTENFLTVSDAADKDKLDVHRHGGGADGLAVKAVIAGVVGSRPAAGVAGRVYFATDTGIFSYDDGTDWDDLIDNDSTQTMAGKTLTSPTLNSPTLTSPIFTGRYPGVQGASVASAANLTLGTDGTYFPISGTTTVNLIDSTGWSGGSVVILKITTGFTFKNNQALSGSFKQMFLAGGVDFVAPANSTISFVYDGVLGIWLELSRRV